MLKTCFLRCSPQVLFSAVELGIIDLLAQAGGGPSGGLTGEQVAEAMRLMRGSVTATTGGSEPLSNEDSVCRLLDACVAVGLVAVVPPGANVWGGGTGAPPPLLGGGDGGTAVETDGRDGGSGATQVPPKGSSSGSGSAARGVAGAFPLVPEPIVQHRPRRYRLAPVSEQYLTSSSTASLAGASVCVHFLP